MAPSTASQQDVETLRYQGLDDRDILEVICRYNLNDRMADATGISSHDFSGWLMRAQLI
ncbi:MAG TPA: hypothetical protein VHM64_04325 [Candidatus Binatia bacterium]|nr:hypothetical protein [Candidatus Binatia bacterium]